MRAKWTDVAHQMLTSLAGKDPFLMGPIPSSRSLAIYYGVSTPVASRAVRFLAGEGVLTRISHGTYEARPGSPEAAAKEVSGWDLNPLNGYWTRPLKSDEPGAEFFRERIS